MQRWQLVQQQNWVMLHIWGKFVNQTKSNGTSKMDGIVQILPGFLFHCARMHSMRLHCSHYRMTSKKDEIFWVFCIFAVRNGNGNWNWYRNTVMHTVFIKFHIWIYLWLKQTKLLSFVGVEAVFAKATSIPWPHFVSQTSKHKATGERTNRQQ